MKNPVGKRSDFLIQEMTEKQTQLVRNSGKLELLIW